MTTVDIAEGRRLLAAATPGPWRWAGYTDGAIELRTRGHGGQRIIAALGSRPCVVELDDGSVALTRTACGSCRHEWGKPDPFTDRETPCEVAENLHTLWLRDEEAGAIFPANRWAVPEVSYRTDVLRVDHPDAEAIVWLRNNAEALLAGTPDLDAQAELHRICELIVSYADASHGVFTGTATLQDVTVEWTRVVDAARARLREAPE